MEDHIRIRELAEPTDLSPRTEIPGHIKYNSMAIQSREDVLDLGCEAVLSDQKMWGFRNSRV